MKPLVSVIVPIYKVQDYLQECIESIIRQTYSNIEIILVDDGSSDECADICDCCSLHDNLTGNPTFFTHTLLPICLTCSLCYTVFEKVTFRIKRKRFRQLKRKFARTYFKGSYMLTLRIKPEF